MHKLILTLGAIALLPGCSKADGELEPGNWRMAMSMDRFDIPGAPAEMQQQANAMTGQAQTMESCMSAARAKLGVRDFSQSMQQGDCQLNGFQSGRGRMSGTMDCKSGALGATTLKMEGTYTPTRVEMTLAGEVAQPSLPGGKADVALRVSSERTGDCKG